jgi:tetratricopeptide (TPR) repeat protein
LALALGKLTHGLEAVFGERSEEHAFLVGQLIGFDCGSSLAVAALGGDGEQLRSRAFVSLMQYFRGLQRRQNCPIVLVLEDLQWADRGSLDFVCQLRPACRDLPILMLCTTRLKLQERSDFSASDGDIELSAMSDASSREMVDTMLGRAGKLHPELGDLVCHKAQGNPYFIVEIVNMMIDEGVIVADGSHWKLQAQRLTEFPVPTTLTGLLQARLDLLPVAEKSLLQKASVIGYVFWDQPLKQVALEVTETLDALGRRDLILRRETSSVAHAREQVFKHHVLHQVTYDSVLKHDRRQLHQLAAEWLLQHSPGRENEFRALIAAHFEQAGDSTNAVIHLRHAAIDASKRFEHEASIAFVNRALHLTPERDLSGRYELIKTRSSSLDLLVRRDEELADLHVLERLANELDDDAKRAEATALRARYAVFTGDDSNAAALAERATVLARLCRDTPIELLAMSIWASALMHQHDYDGAELIATRMLERAAGADEYRRHIDALHLLGGLAAGRGRYSDARAKFEQALELARANGNLLFEAIQLHNVADVERQLGNFVRARDQLEHGLRVCTRVGAQKIQLHLLSQLARVEISSGSPEVALELISQAQALAPALRNTGMEADLLSIRGRAEFDLEHATDALTSYRASLGIYEQAGMWREAAEPMAGLARTLLVRGEIDEALSMAEKIEVRLAADLDGCEAIDLLLVCSQVHAAGGQPVRAGALLGRARDLLRRQAERLDLSDRHRFLNEVAINAAVSRL